MVQYNYQFHILYLVYWHLQPVNVTFHYITNILLVALNKLSSKKKPAKHFNPYVRIQK